MAGLEKCLHGHILNKSKENVDLNDDKYKGKVIGLYFSAHWFVLFISSNFLLTFICKGVHHVVDSPQF